MWTLHNVQTDLSPDQMDELALLKSKSYDIDEVINIPSIASSSKSNITLGTVASPSILDGLNGAFTSNRFEIDSVSGSAINRSGKVIPLMFGTLSLQIYMSGGDTLYIYSEQSPDGINWTKNPNSLRTKNIANNGEGYITISSFLANWNPDVYARFRLYCKSGNIKLDIPSETIEGEVVEGFSAIWAMREFY